MNGEKITKIFGSFSFWWYNGENNLKKYFYMPRNFNCVCAIGNTDYFTKIKDHFGVELNYLNVLKEKFSIQYINLVLCENPECLVVLQKKNSGVQKRLISNNIKFREVNLSSKNKRPHYLNRSFA